MGNLANQYATKLKDIQSALQLLENDHSLAISASKEMAFNYVPGILSYLESIIQENEHLHTEIVQLCIENDDILKQNLLFSEKLKQISHSRTVS